MTSAFNVYLLVGLGGGMTVIKSGGTLALNPTLNFINCSVCGLKLESSLLQQHMKIHKAFQCPYCDFIGSSGLNLQGHIHFTHSNSADNEKPNLPTILTAKTVTIPNNSDYLKAVAGECQTYKSQTSIAKAF